MNSRMFEGVITALATPFKHGDLDLNSFRRLIKFQLDQEVEGFVINGTTGESPTLTANEVKTLFEVARYEVGHQIPLLVGSGLNCTKKTIELTEVVRGWGADGALIVTPYYNRPPQRGLYEHFKKVAESVRIPIVLYNVPSRTGVSLDKVTLVGLAKEPSIIGIKEASGNMDLLRNVQGLVKENFLFTSGDDDSCMQFVAQGGHGVISVISHLIGGDMVSLIRAIKTGNMDSVHQYEAKYKGLLKAIYAETNPIGIKYGLYLKGVIDSPEMRLPLIEMDAAKAKDLEVALASVGMG